MNKPPSGWRLSGFSSLPTNNGGEISRRGPRGVAASVLEAYAAVLTDRGEGLATTCARETSLTQRQPTCRDRV